MGRAQFVLPNPTPWPLMRHGCNMRVEIATASAMVGDQAQRNSVTLWAHVDIGASRTTISPRVATLLNLVPMGTSRAHTAGGAVENPTYAIDLLFPGSTLASRIDLEIASCSLPFDPERLASAPKDPTNFGMLIGRDVMSKWHMSWDGPTSMVIITE